MNLHSDLHALLDRHPLQASEGCDAYRYSLTVSAYGRQSRRGAL